MDQPKLLIAGEWVATERALPVLNPYDESVITEVPVATGDTNHRAHREAQR
jgi:acyl-CoA reductase-like NAD-dependent aldehyde dehydrogenase